MVVHEDSCPNIENAMEMESKKYVIIKNHVREIPVEGDISKVTIISEDGSPSPIKKAKLKQYKTKSKSASSLSDHPTPENIASVDPADLLELRTMYYKCKAIVNKIEQKYGHLLDLNEEELNKTKYFKGKRKLDESSQDFDECSCKRNKRIVFDEFGNQTELECDPKEDHAHHRVCSLKFIKSIYNDPAEDRNIVFENYEKTSDLPDDLKSLSNILKDTSLNTQERYNAVSKLLRVKYEYMNSIKFNKKLLSEQLKSNPDEQLNFKGTNLYTLKGYII